MIEFFNPCEAFMKLKYLKNISITGIIITSCYLLFLAIVFPSALVDSGISINNKIENYDNINKFKELCKDLVKRNEAMQRNFIFHARIWFIFQIVVLIIFIFNLIYLNRIEKINDKNNKL